MSDLISRNYLYEKIAKYEELARDRVLDTPSLSPFYPRYVAQLNERTALKHEIMDAPTVEAKEVVHGKWVMRGGRLYCSNCGNRALLEKDRDDWYGYVASDFCPHCGADM